MRASFHKGPVTIRASALRVQGKDEFFCSIPARNTL
jgi:hypothetical protein